MEGKKQLVCVGEKNTFKFLAKNLSKCVIRNRLPDYTAENVSVLPQSQCVFKHYKTDGVTSMPSRHLGPHSLINYL